MTGQPQITVIMGVYNGQRFMQEAIESILTQSFREFEFVICDDCSNDETPKILGEYAQKDSRVRVIRNQKNLGLAASLNRCIEMARGQYLARMDSDDRSDPKRLESQLAYMQAHPEVAVVGTGAYYMDDNGKVYGQRVQDSETVYTLRDVVKYNPLIHPTVMMRSECVKAVGGYTANTLTTRAEDYDLWCKLCEAKKKLVALPELLFFYREDSNNIIKRKYRYRLQEAGLKFQWIRRSQMPAYYYGYAIRPLLVGLVPLWLYKRLQQRKRMQGSVRKQN